MSIYPNLNSHKYEQTITPQVCDACISALVSARSEFIDKLYPSYGYDDLVYLVNKIKEAQSLVTVSDKKIYDVFSGRANNKKFINSAISWIPSREVVSAIKQLAMGLGFKQIDVLSAEIGILPALLKKELHDKDLHDKDLHDKENNISILAADTFENQSTCNSVDYVDIAKRRISDYTYYEAIAKPYPELVIIYNYVHGCLKRYENIVRLLESMKHKVVMIFSSIFASSGFETPFNYLTNTDKYTIYSFPVKSIDMYHDIQQEVKNVYPYSMVGHILINKHLVKDFTIDMLILLFANGTLSNHSYASLGQQGLNGTIKIFETLPFKLFKSLFRKLDLIIPFALSPLVLNIEETFSKLKKMKITRVPEYIYDIGEYAQWIVFLDKKIYLNFNSRDQFFTFYTEMKALASSSSNDSNNFNDFNDSDISLNTKYKFPSWIDNFNKKTVYIYLTVIKATGNWRGNWSSFGRIWNAVNYENKTKLTSE